MKEEELQKQQKIEKGEIWLFIESCIKLCYLIIVPTYDVLKQTIEKLLNIEHSS